MIAADYKFPDLLSNFEITFKPITRQVKSFKEEISETAKQVYAISPNPLYLMYSGGIDSEAMALAFLENNIPFKAITFRYPNNINQIDIDYSVKFCKKNNIEHIIADINPIIIYRDLLLAGNKFLGVWWNYLEVEMIDYIDKLGGCAVLGRGAMFDRPLKTINGEITLNYSPGSFLHAEYCKNNNKIHCPEFYLTNPEIYASCFKDPLIAHLLTEPNYFKNRNHTPLIVDDSMKEFSYPNIEKLMMFYKFWPDMERRPKYDGFEKLRPVFRQLEKQFKDNNIPTPIAAIKKVTDIQIELGLKS